ncbi:hypothetical protein ACIBG4_37560 [Nonomuraea sp. NPDC050383]
MAARTGMREAFDDVVVVPGARGTINDFIFGVVSADRRTVGGRL